MKRKKFYGISSALLAGWLAISGSIYTKKVDEIKSLEKQEQVLIKQIKETKNKILNIERGKDQKRLVAFLKEIVKKANDTNKQIKENKEESESLKELNTQIGELNYDIEKFTKRLLLGNDLNFVNNQMNDYEKKFEDLINNKRYYGDKFNSLLIDLSNDFTNKVLAISYERIIDIPFYLKQDQDELKWDIEHRIDTLLDNFKDKDLSKLKDIKEQILDVIDSLEEMKKAAQETEKRIASLKEKIEDILYPHK